MSIVTSLLGGATAFGQVVNNSSGGITIRDNSTAQPFPSKITVPTSVTGKVEKIQVKLNGITHGYPDDLDIVLVNPQGKWIKLMSDVGGETNLTGFDLTIDDNGGAFHTENQINAGVYKPTDVDDGTDAAEALLGAANKVATFGPTGNMVGEYPNGDWLLYVWDDSPNDEGSIASWSLSLWTAPTITVASNAMAIAEDSNLNNNANKFYFNIVNSGTNPDLLKYSLTSSDSAKVGTSQVFGGSGAARWVAITNKPNANTKGGAPVTLTIRAASTNTTTFYCESKTFDVTVNAVNDTPIAPSFVIPAYHASNKYTAVTNSAGQAMPLVRVDFDDVDTTDDDGAKLVLNVSSDNPSLVAVTNVDISGTGDSRWVVITPNGTGTGEATLTFNVTDTTKLDGSDNVTGPSATLKVRLDALNPGGYYQNVSRVVIPNGGTTTSKITVANATGLVNQVTVTLADFNAATPQNLDLLLVKTNLANGQVIKVPLMGQAGGTTAVDHGRLLFSASASGDIPSGALNFADPNYPVASYKTKDYDPNDDPPPAGVTPAANLDAFKGIDPNGEWVLYARSSSGEAYITDGWLLRVIYTPYIVPSVSLTKDEDFGTYNIAFAVGSQNSGASVTNVWISNYSPAAGTIINGPAIVNGNGGRTFTISGGTANTNISSKANLFGDTVITINAKDSYGLIGTYNYTIKVNPVNDAPNMTVIPKQTAFAGVPPDPVSFTITDVDNVASDMRVSVTSSDQALLPDANIIVTPNGLTYSIMMFPISGASRTIRITVALSDSSGGSISQGFDLAISPPGAYLQVKPDLITINDKVAPWNGAATPWPSTMTVNGLVGKLEDVQVTLMGVTHGNPEDIDVLLVAPGTDGNNKMIYLMSDAGSGGPLNNGQLVFKASTRTLGQLDQITSGYYTPVNYDTGSDDPTNSANLVTTMASLIAGTPNPNGVWQLYVFDDTPAQGPEGNQTHRGGLITGGWMLNLTTQPKISLPDSGVVFTTKEDTWLTTNIVVGDPQTANAFTVILRNDYNDIVSAWDAQVSQGSLRLIIKPEPDKFGTNVGMELVVTDSYGQQDIKSLDFRVTADPDAPRFTVNTPEAGYWTSPVAMPIGPIRFNVKDAWGESLPGQITGITLAKSSDSPTKIPAGNVTLTPLGNGDWDLTAMPIGTASGLVKITLTATDADNLTSKQDINIMLTSIPGLTTASPETNPIQIPDRGIALAPNYPSTINVSRVAGVVSKATVILQGFHHTYPADVDMLLVHGNKAVMLMSDVGGSLPGIPASDPRRIIISDDATQSFLPGSAPASGTYKPTNNDTTSDALPSAPAPTGTAMAEFNGIDPNGDWKLYVQDDDWDEHGAIDGGWILILETAPKIWADRTTLVTSQGQRTSVTISLGDQDTWGTNISITPTIIIGENTDSRLLTMSSFSWSTNDTAGTNRTLMIEPTAHLAGTAQISLVATDDKNNPSSALVLNLTVTDINETPIISFTHPETNYYTLNEEAQKTLTFTILDFDSQLWSSNITVASLSTGIIPQNKVSWSRGSADGSTNAPLTLTVTPAANATGTATLRVSASDLNTTQTADITLVYNPVNDQPTIAFTNATLTVEAGKAGTAYFTVGDVETPNNLQVFAKSLNALAVPTSYIELSGTGANRAIKVTTIGDGVNNNVANIEVYVYDPAGVNDDAPAGTQSTNKTILTVTTTPPTTRTFTKTEPIIINDNAAATPYPSVINVSGLVGTINKVNVLVDGFTHNRPEDVDVMLVGPNGKSLMLFSDAGDSYPISNVRIIFDDAGRIIPLSNLLDNGTNAPPGNYDVNDQFPVDGSNPITNNMVLRLADFAGIDPNGDWKLYVVDDTANSTGGAIAYGWALLIETAPAITANKTLVEWNEDGLTTGFGTVDITVRDDTKLPWLMRWTSSNESLIPNSGIVASTPVTNGNAVTYTFTLNSKANAYGTNYVAFKAERNDGVTSTVYVTNRVASVNDVPTLSRMTDKQMDMNTQLDVDMILGDVDTSMANLSIKATATSTVADLLPDSGLIFQYGTVQTNYLASLANLPADGYLKLTLKPTVNKWGVATVKLAITDLFDTN